jgi:hypothetical protein
VKRSLSKCDDSFGRMPSQLLIRSLFLSACVNGFSGAMRSSPDEAPNMQVRAALTCGSS